VLFRSPEPAVSGFNVLQQLTIAGLEEVQGHRQPRKEHETQRKERQKWREHGQLWSEGADTRRGYGPGACHLTHPSDDPFPPRRPRTTRPAPPQNVRSSVRKSARAGRTKYRTFPELLTDPLPNFCVSPRLAPRTVTPSRDHEARAEASTTK